MLPVVRRTWAPRGQTPILHHVGRYREKVSAISAITVSPKRRRLRWFVRFHPKKNIRWMQTIVFLRLLLRHLPGRVLVLWDRGRPHWAKETTRFLHRCRRRLHVEWFPSYAPDLNPDEHVWADLKHHRIPNHGFPSAKILHRRLLYHARRIHADQRILRGCIQASELPLRTP